MTADAQACDRCHRRKTRCDKRRPDCGACARASAPCVYSERAREPIYRRDFVERLEKRLHQLEIANRDLREQLAVGRRERSSDLDPGSASNERNEERQAGRSGDDVANEVSFLSTSAGGDRQFLGSASGLLFASLVRAGAANAFPRGADSSAVGPSGGEVAGSGKPDWTIEDRTLPPQQLAKRLIEAYLAHDHLSYPFLHPQSVRNAVDAIYADTAHYLSHPFDAFMINMIMAIATCQVHKFNWQALPDAETYHRKAMCHLNSVLRHGGLRALQAMLLLCQFRLSSSTKDASGSRSSSFRSPWSVC